MKQFLLKEKPDKDGLIRLYGDDYHYLVHVRRLKPGNVFSAILPETGTIETANSRQITVTVRSTGKRTLTGVVTDHLPSLGVSPIFPIPPIVLFQALPKGAKMDLVIRQAAELGINEIVPFVSEHSVPKKAQGGEKPDRWLRIIKEARQQSGSAVDTIIHKTLGIEELFSYWEQLQAENRRTTEKPEESTETLGLIFSPWTDAMADSNKVQSSHNKICGDGNPLEKGGFHQYLSKRPPLLVLAVGPEGGFSPAELKRFAEAGFKALSLGNTVLRTETAALYGAAAAKVILMERQWWKLTQQ